MTWHFTNIIKRWLWPHISPWPYHTVQKSLSPVWLRIITPKWTAIDQSSSWPSPSLTSHLDGAGLEAHCTWKTSAKPTIQTTTQQVLTRHSDFELDCKPDLLTINCINDNWTFVFGWVYIFNYSLNHSTIWFVKKRTVIAVWYAHTCIINYGM